MSKSDLTPVGVWPLAPLIPGDWRELSLADGCAVLSRYAALEVAFGKSPSADQLEFTGVRVLRVPSSPRWLLVESAARFPDGADGILTFFYGPEHRIQPAVWSPSAIEFVAWPGGDVDEPVVGDYLRLAVNYTCGNNGRMCVVESADDVRARALDPASLAPELLARAVPIEVNRAEFGFLARATIMYDAQLFQAEFDVESDGTVNMIGDDPIGDAAGIREEARGAFRVRVATPEPEQVAAAQSVASSE